MTRKNIHTITAHIEPEGRTSTVVGRTAWALKQLMAAGESGCTPIHHPAPRWSMYVLLLREAGFKVETINEKHGGPYSGTHGRYVLRSGVQVLQESEGQA